MRGHVIAARRTAVAPRGGAFRDLTLEALATPVIAALLSDAGIAAAEVDEVIVANAIGTGGNPARRIALAAGLGERVAGLTTDRQCAGGLDALLLAGAMVASGMARVVIAGGVESYSQRPERRMPGAAAPYDEAPFTPWADRDPAMAEAADALAERLGIARARQDGWAIESHRKAQAGGMGAEIVPVAGLAQDAFARALTPALAARAKAIHGSITAANAAVAADGAGFALVVAPDIAARAPRALAFHGITLGSTPWEPGTAPLAAMRALIGPAAPDLAEVMEAYAAQAIACVEGAGLDPAIVNRKGGALARGHPIGASGAILAVRVFHDLRQGRGLAAIAAAGGIGTAVMFEA